MAKKKWPSKAQMIWEVGKEQEKIVRKGIPDPVEGYELDEFFKLVRGSEYRRGKEDECNRILKILDEYIKHTHDDLTQCGCYVCHHQEEFRTAWEDVKTAVNNT